MWSQEDNLIKTSALIKKYGEVIAVDGIDLNIQQGEIYGFLGPNGAGKTSTIMMLLGVSSPTSGEIYLFNERYTPDRLDLRRRIGVVPEKHPRGMWTWMTGVEYLELFADLFRVRNAGRRIVCLLQQVGLTEAADRKIVGYSRGMLQKLSIVRALLPDPDMLFLDEPISGLDPIGIRQIRDLVIAKNREGRTIFISSHLLSEMEKVCHRIAVIHRGRLMAEDTTDKLLLKLSSAKDIELDFENVPEELIGDIGALEFVIDCSIQDGTVMVKVPTEGDYRKPLSEFLIKKGLIPLRLAEKRLSLEEAFVTITNENVSQLTGVGSTS
jgi:ABC-2 type transport system ATP-binding protein